MINVVTKKKWATGKKIEKNAASQESKKYFSAF